jgi:hypothetical protein
MRINSINELTAAITQGDGYARSNLFTVELPAIGKVNARGINLLTKSISIPTRQINALTREVSMKNTEVPYGFTNTELTMTFRVMNDAGVRSYFDKWHDSIVGGIRSSGNGQALGYYKDYVQTIKVHQLKKTVAAQVFKKDFGLRLPPLIKNRLRALGPLNIGNDIFNVGIGVDGIEADLNLSGTKSYTWEFYEAYPLTIQNETLSDDNQGGLSEITVSFQYKNFSGVSAEDTNPFNKAKSKIEDALFDLKADAQASINKRVKKILGQ